ncbi:hypothetical protein N7456_008731 [Penicillium angulare]|uniref:AB hydrolase-1 domain-containing protein n=1 Tax=Penicillium angulare TaxID=116970 RepID=A0A9W9F3C6_9EURO|nr:hypothetical protein N7456_008731 [Penicillium angulare]
MADISTFPFIITEHVIDAQYIREYPNATVDSNPSLKLVLKKYTPKNNPNPQLGDVTIIGAHGCGFPKELYEPLWEDLLARSEKDGLRIRSIWIADVSNLGASGVENESSLGNDPSWIDHSRDLLHMINHFREEMPQPIVGVGHSMGAGQLVLLSLLHPRLFTSLSLIEPVIAPDILSAKGPLLAIVSLKRRDTWKSRSAAIEAAHKTYKRWDKRVLHRWILHGYREIPTTHEARSNNSNATESDSPVMLVSSKNQEVLQYLRPNPSNHRPVGEGEDNDASDKPAHDSLLYPDIIGPPHATSQFYRFEPIFAWKMLKHVRPPVLYVLGQQSPLFSPEDRARTLNRTGRGIGGSGGIKASKVEEKIIKGSHQLPLERVVETAAAVGPWISKSLQTWRENEVRIAKGWIQQPLDKRLEGMAEWVPMLEKLGDLEVSKRDSRL